MITATLIWLLFVGITSCFFAVFGAIQDENTSAAGCAISLLGGAGLLSIVLAVACLVRVYQ